MAHEKAKTSAKTLNLPVSVTGRSDVGRLLREAKLLDDFLQQAAIRQPGSSTKLPRTTRLMDELVQSNSLNPLVEADRKQLLSFLEQTHQHAPVITMSFNADPSPLFLQKLMTWLRREIHPNVLLQTGLQPGIGAGCTVRTASKFFDFSLREHFVKQRSVLLAKLEGVK